MILLFVEINRTPILHFIYFRKLVDQLIGDFGDKISLKFGIAFFSNKEERRNGKLQIS